MPKPKLTPEEKRELRKQKKLGRKRQKEEQKRQVKRDQLAREVKYGALTIRKYEKNWREMLTRVALPRMRTELEFAWHHFERVMDAKDFTISLLKDEVLGAEEQYMHNFRAHSENLDKLVALLGDRLEEFKREYDEGAGRLQEQCETEAEDLKEVSNENLNYIKTMLFYLETAKKGQKRTKRSEYYSRLDENGMKNQFLLQKLKANLESKYQHMFDDIKRFVQDYHKQIKERKKEYTKLKVADDAIQELITQQCHQIKKLHDTLRHLRQKFGDMKQTEGSLLQDVQIKRQFFSNSFITLKRNLADDQREDFSKMARLSECCAIAFDHLEKLDNKGTAILTLAAICRKLETQKEKILAFPDTQGTIHETVIGDADEDLVRRQMELFWQRVGQVYGVHYALERERQCLSEENRLIIDTHKDYCEKLK